MEKTVTEADVKAAIEYLSGVHNREQAYSAIAHLRPEVVAELERRGLMPAQYA